MKTVKYYILMLLIITFYLSSCSKNAPAPKSVAALNIVNTVIGSTAIVTNFNSNLPLQYYSSAYQLSYGSYNEFSGYIGFTPISFADFSDTTLTILKTSLRLTKGSIYTLFLTGTMIKPDTVYTTDNLPYHKSTDSVTGVRFINLSPDSKPISVNIEGNALGSEVISLKYKQITPFKFYPATTNLPEGGQYTFEIRDVATGNLLTTNTYTTLSGNMSTVFKNVTIVIYGEENGSGNYPLNSFLVNNY